MDKINENIQLQQNVLSTFKSDEVVRGLEKYVEAANHFVGITQSLNKFEEARRMMLAAAQETINYQNQYAEWLQIPREIVVRLNDILNRIKNFEENIDRVGEKLAEREILGNDVVNAIRDQINGIDKKSRIADSYLQIADGKLEDLFREQTAVIEKLNQRYRAAIQGHIVGFEEIMDDLTRELEGRHRLFIDAMEEKLSISDIRQEFSNLKKLDVISEEVKGISNDLSRSNDILISINRKQDVSEKADSKNQQKVNEYIERDLQSKEEVRQLRQENDSLKKGVEELTDKISQLQKEIQRQKEYQEQRRNFSHTYRSDEESLTIAQSDAVTSNPSSEDKINLGNSVTSMPRNEKVEIGNNNEEEQSNKTTETQEIEENTEETTGKKGFSLFGIFRRKKS